MNADFMTGLATSLALIIAIGSQNAYVLRQGIRREHVAALVLFCSASDALLILAGILLGVGTPLAYLALLLTQDNETAFLRASLAAHAEAHCDDGVQIVVLDLPGDLSSAFLANYPEFPDSCLSPQFPFLEDVSHVLVDSPHIFLEELRDERLR